MQAIINTKLILEDSYVWDGAVTFENGRIVQCGRHEQLSATEGVYKNMWDAYTSAYHWTLNKN